MSKIRVHSSNVTYTPDSIEACLVYHGARVVGKDVFPLQEDVVIKTSTTVPKLGVMLVGWGGNNGSTITAGVIANRCQMKWRTKEGENTADYLGSLTQASTMKLGLNEAGEPVHVPFTDVLPMVHPNDIVFGGWDISSLDLASSMRRAKVIDYALQEQLVPHMEHLRPLPSVYCASFIAANQEDRADNVLRGTKQEQLDVLRGNIRDFKTANACDKVIVLWTANTERFCEVRADLNGSTAALLRSIAANHSEVSPSTMFAVASILEGCSYINGSPQNTFVPGVLELAQARGVFIGGDDFKSGQTKIKSCLVDFLVSAGIKPQSIVSYNHLGNNDGFNLSAPEQFRSKEISKSNVVDDMVASNSIMYSSGEHPDHTVVIKYVPFVGDSKRAMDEYTSSIFLGGRNTIVMHNTCEDSLLACPIILDLVILTELCGRIQMKQADAPASEYENFHSVLSILSYLLKAPLVPLHTPVVNALFAQRQCIVNVFRACVGLAPENFLLFEHKVPFMMKAWGVGSAVPRDIDAAMKVAEREREKEKDGSASSAATTGE